MPMTVPDACAQLQAAARGLFGDDVAVATCDPRLPQPALLPGEAAHLARAIVARRREFAAGRAAARAAIAALGGAPLPIPAAPDRAPIWPEGWQGSISHSATLCLAVVTRAPLTLGVDLEPDHAMNENIIATICSKMEIGRISGPEMAHHATLIFSAKEAAYKAQYPLTGLLFGFDNLDITLHPTDGSFTATFLKPAGRFAIGDTLPGRYARATGHLVTAVTIGQGAVKGA